jgi:multiple sugar transport system permease protein
MGISASLGRAAEGRKLWWRLNAATREEIAFYFFISPWLIGLLAFTLGPMIASLFLSFTKYDVITPMRWIGLENYRIAFLTDPLFWQSLKVTTIYVLGSVPLQMILGLVVAILMNQALRGITLFRTVYYIPAVISGVPLALLWMAIFNPYGVVNGFLARLSIKGPNWLFSEEWVIPAFIIMSLWGIGGTMIIYLAALQGVPQHLYEAADLDGAGAVAKFWNVTVPMISPVIFFNLVMAVIGSFQTFTNALVMTSGGPNNASLFYMLHLYRNAFSYFKMGYGCALAWVLAVIILALTMLVIKSSPAWVYYEGMIGGRQQ